MNQAGRLSYANVMATVAVVIAIGGGIAIAGGQKDRAAKPAVVYQGSAALPDGGEKRLVNVPKIGRFVASAATSGAPSGGVTYTNTTNTTLRLTWLVGGRNFSEPQVSAGAETVKPGGTHYFGTTSFPLDFHVTFHPASAAKSSPMASASIVTEIRNHWVQVVKAK